MAERIQRTLALRFWQGILAFGAILNMQGSAIVKTAQERIAELGAQ